jgi:galactose oxidase-like protein/Kelch motif protein
MTKMAAYPAKCVVVYGAMALATVITMLVTGCGGDSSAKSLRPATTSATLSGNVSQGPMAGATVTVFSVNPSNGLNQSVLGQTQTDSAGNFSIGFTAVASEPVRITASSGTFISEQNGAMINGPAELSLLLGTINSGFSGLSINPLTEFVSSLTVGKLRGGGSSVSIALPAAISAIDNDYGLANNPAFASPNYSAGAIGSDAGKVGLVLGALINEDQQLCPTHPGGLVDALASDIADGAFDGMSFGAPVPYCGGTLEPIAGISVFQDALSGVQQLQLLTGAFVFGGAGNALTIKGITPSQLLLPLSAINVGVGLAAPISINSFAPAALAAAMNRAHAAATATLLPNGKVLIAGGAGSGVIPPPIGSVELYDPASNSYAPAASTPTMNQARFAATATLLPNGKVIIAGGFAPSGSLSSVELYDPASNSFASAASLPAMNTARSNATATLLLSGKVLIAGGGGNSGPLDSVELYDPVTNSFAASTPLMNEPREGATATLLPNGKVLIAGGVGNSGPLGSVELYDPVANSFAASTPLMNEPRVGATATLLPNGKVLIAGGGGNSGPLGSVELYDPASSSFAPAASLPAMNTARSNATATLLPNGKVPVAGGLSQGFHSNPPLNEVDLYDPASNSFAPAASTPTMNLAREGATATLLPNGKVLIAGGSAPSAQGFGPFGPLSSTELYTP